MEPQTVFIGSSSEACHRGIVPRLESLLTKNDFKVVTWYDDDEFAPGEYTLDALLSIVKQTDLALFVFSKDDEVKVRGKAEFAPRDNVLVEYGLFTSHLGRRRVAVIQEDGVKMPIDVNGMGVARFSSSDDPRRSPTLEIAVNDLTRRWQTLDDPPPSGRVVDDGFGFADTVARSRERLDSLTSRLWSYHRSKARSEHPVNFDSKKCCVSTYAEALDRVTNRFWTTTYLSSGFWSKPQAAVLEANKQMMARLVKSGEARRLFLIQQPLSEEIEAWKEHQILDRKLGRTGRLKARERGFKQLRANLAELIKAGCKVRVTHDDTHAFNALPVDMQFKENDSELAIYDRFRVDVFEGGSAGAIDGVRCYTPAICNFSAYLEQAEEYFAKLWDTGSDMSAFIDALESAVDAASARIDYESNWLAFYELGLGPEDTNLKVVESKRVEEVLRRLGRWGQLEKCLDIGTCTGRYPMFLAHALTPHGVVIGIDDDVDCVRFAQKNVARQCPDERRIHILREDFTTADLTLKSGFDLITCMLGTLSHFGRDRRGPVSGEFRDGLQDTLSRMASLLQRDGLLILGTWSDQACVTRHMLGIYKDCELERLAAWTPRIHELRQRLRQVGLEIVDEAQPDVRLDLTVCRLARH
jgi:SAM-dependent methyltransferase